MSPLQHLVVSLTMVCSVGCGLVNYDSLGTSEGDARVPDVDAMPLGDFETPTRIDELNTAGRNQDPTVSEDLLEIVWSSNRSGGAGDQDLWTARRADPDAPWGPPENITQLNSPNKEVTPDISADGLSLFFGINVSEVRTQNVSTRATRDDPWGPPTVIPGLSTSLNESGVAVDGAILQAIVASSATGNNELYLSTRPDTASPWGTATLLDILNSPQVEVTPSLSADGLVVYFASDRTESVGARDIYRAWRPSLSEPFSSPEPVASINTEGNETDPWVSADERVIVFATGGAFGDELYIGRR